MKNAPQRARGMISALALMAILFLVLIIAATFQVSALAMKRQRLELARTQLGLLEQSAIAWNRAGGTVGPSPVTLDLTPRDAQGQWLAELTQIDSQSIQVASVIRVGKSIVGRLETQVASFQVPGDEDNISNETPAESKEAQ